MATAAPPLHHNSFPHMQYLYRDGRDEPSAVELLEATKRLYVKTDILKDTKIDPATPRIFHSPLQDNEIEDIPRPRVIPMKPSYSSTLRPSLNSAFRPVPSTKWPSTSHLDLCIPSSFQPSSSSPPRPPKSNRIRQRARKLNGICTSPTVPDSSSPPPLPPRSSKPSLLNDEERLEDIRRNSSPIVHPIPVPRLSKISSSSIHPIPPPIPRRRTIQLDSTTFISQSSPELSLSPSPSPLRPSILRSSPSQPCTPIRRRFVPSSLRPSTPIPSHQEERKDTPKLSLETPVLSSPSDIVGREWIPCKQQRIVRRQTTLTLSLPSSSFPLSSPTSKATSKDSGLQPSDEEEENRRRYQYYVNVNNEQTNEMKEEEESIFTSITNQPRMEEFNLSSPSALSPSFSRPLSVIEKHARVISWIQSSDYNECPLDLPHTLPFIGTSRNV